MNLTHMNAKKIAAGVLLVIAIMGACKKKDETNSTDANFLKNASYANNNEVDAGRLAASKATDSLVKNFANMMVHDHSNAQNELRNLAMDKNIPIAGGPDAVHQAKKAELSASAGRAFDSVYIHLQVTDHQNAVNLFQDELNNGKNEDVKAYASKYLPGIRAHLTLADTLAKKY